MPPPPTAPPPVPGLPDALAGLPLLYDPALQRVAGLDVFAQTLGRWLETGTALAPETDGPEADGVIILTPQTLENDGLPGGRGPVVLCLVGAPRAGIAPLVARWKDLPRVWFCSPYLPEELDESGEDTTLQAPGLRWICFEPDDIPAEVPEAAPADEGSTVWLHDGADNASVEVLLESLEATAGVQSVGCRSLPALHAGALEAAARAVAQASRVVIDVADPVAEAWLLRRCTASGKAFVLRRGLRSSPARAGSPADAVALLQGGPMTLRELLAALAHANDGGWDEAFRRLQAYGGRGISEDPAPACGDEAVKLPYSWLLRKSAARTCFSDNEKRWLKAARVRRALSGVRHGREGRLHLWQVELRGERQVPGCLPGEWIARRLSEDARLWLECVAKEWAGTGAEALRSTRGLRRILEEVGYSHAAGELNGEPGSVADALTATLDGLGVDAGAEEARALRLQALLLNAGAGRSAQSDSFPTTELWQAVARKWVEQLFSATGRARGRTEARWLAGVFALRGTPGADEGEVAFRQAWLRLWSEDWEGAAALVEDAGGRSLTGVPKAAAKLAECLLLCGRPGLAHRLVEPLALEDCATVAELLRAGAVLAFGGGTGRARALLERARGITGGNSGACEVPAHFGGFFWLLGEAATEGAGEAWLERAGAGEGPAQRPPWLELARLNLREAWPKEGLPDLRPALEALAPCLRIAGAAAHKPTNR